MSEQKLYPLQKLYPFFSIFFVRLEAVFGCSRPCRLPQRHTQRTPRRKTPTTPSPWGWRGPPLPKSRPKTLLRPRGTPPTGGVGVAARRGLRGHGAMSTLARAVGRVAEDLGYPPGMHGGVRFPPAEATMGSRTNGGAPWKSAGGAQGVAGGQVAP